jgi:pyruvate,water dikinase
MSDPTPLVLEPGAPGSDDPDRVGGKGAALSALARSGLPIPTTLSITTTAYDLFVDRGLLRPVIRQELGRKNFDDMRWEEIWDTALRIRNRFLRTPIPIVVERELEAVLAGDVWSGPLAVRSSAPGEDAGDHSFAGLHDSIIGVRGLAATLDAIRTVWASLWTDRALLYRRELGIEPESSSMAVVIQPLIEGAVSGIGFGAHPTRRGQLAVEAVFGLNQALVDGSVEPDRWTIDAETGAIVEHVRPARRRRMIVADGGTEIVPVDGDEAPLDENALGEVSRVLATAGELFGSPQDMEWTISDGGLVVLQSRPITTSSDSDGDKRAWYLSLTRSLDNLRELRQRVEHEMLPAMNRDADEIAAVGLEGLDDDGLAAEIERRRSAHDRWVDLYWRDFIPLAHGIRLFGELYNQIIRPEDPYEFMSLLAATPMLSVRRNSELSEMAALIRDDHELRASLAAGAADGALEDRIASFLAEFGAAVYDDHACFADRGLLVRLLLTMADHPPAEPVADAAEIDRLTERFLGAVEASRRPLAEEALDIGRASYRLRDDDNLYLGRLESLLLDALDEGRRRIRRSTSGTPALTDPDQILRALRHPNLVAELPPDPTPIETTAAIRARPRQLVGQPAGPGVAIGTARVVRRVEDLFDFSAGEVLVCDAVDPGMTFVVPVASAVIERRGGMLIHGAIIAREYGLPCVTGVPDATDRIATGDRLTVDGFLGIVVVDTTE